MTPEEQLQKWVNGKSVHNDEEKVCLPDFSCCNKAIDTQHFQRKRFQKAFLEGDVHTVLIMCKEFHLAHIKTRNTNSTNDNKVKT